MLKFVFKFTQNMQCNKYLNIRNNGRFMALANINIYVYNGAIQTFVVDNQLIRQNVKYTTVCSSITIYVGSNSACSLKALIIWQYTLPLKKPFVLVGSWHLIYVYPSCSASRINLYAKVGVYYKYV